MDLHVRRDGDGHRLHGDGGDVGLVNRYLAHLAARGFSPATVRAYAFDVLNFLRFCAQRRLGLAAAIRRFIVDAAAPLRRSMRTTVCGAAGASFCQSR